MEEIVYIDQYFFYNFAMDAIALFIVSRALPRTLRIPRFLLASAFGAFYALALFVAEASYLLSLLTFLPAAAFLCLIAFPLRSLRTFLRTLVFFLLSVILLGGTVYAANLLVGKSVENASLSLLFVGLLLLLAACVFSLYFFYLRRRHDSKIKTVLLPPQFSRTPCTAFIDSGNLLCDPTTGLRVVLISADAAMRLLSPALKLSLYTGSEHGSNELFPIHATSAGGTCFFYAVRCSGARVQNTSAKRQRPLPDFLLACDTRNRDYAGCDLLMPLNIL